jgi:hypothetical protein
MATTRLDRKGFLKSLGVLAAAVVARPARAGAAEAPRNPELAAKGPLTARKAPQAVARRADLA